MRAIHVGQKDSFRRFVIQYHRRLLLDGTLMVQVLLMMSILPYIFLLSGAAGASKNIGGLSPYLTPQYSGATGPCCLLDRCFQQFWRLDQYRYFAGA